MNDQHWQQIEEFNLDYPIAEYGFSTRLAYENGWTTGFTQTAILEYKKFMFLAATADQMVSPSEIVDIVWHQHLIFTQSYEQFCQLLGKKIEHIPSTHNYAEKEKFGQAKERTARLYEASFGEQPAAFWEHTTLTGSMGLEQSGLSPKTLTWFSILTFLLLIYPAYLVLRPVYVEIDNPYFLIGYAVLVVLTFRGLKKYNYNALGVLLRSLLFNPVITRLTASELVYLKTRQIEHVIRGFVNRLMADEVLDVTTDGMIFTNDKKKQEDPLAHAVVETVLNAGEITYADLIAQLSTKPAFIQVTHSTSIVQHLLRSKDCILLFIFNYAAMMILFLLGFTRLVIGIERERPVVFIAFSLIVLLIASINFLFKTVESVTRSALPRLYEEEIIPAAANTGLYLNWDWQYFLLGSAVLTTSFIPLMPNRSNYGYGVDASTGSSCGGGGGSSCGSGCGSSCGGCGGGD